MLHGLMIRFLLAFNLYFMSLLCYIIWTGIVAVIDCFLHYFCSRYYARKCGYDCSRCRNWRCHYHECKKKREGG